MNICPEPLEWRAWCGKSRAFVSISRKDYAEVEFDICFNIGYHIPNKYLQHFQGKKIYCIKEVNG